MIFDKDKIKFICFDTIKPLWNASSKDFPGFLTKETEKEANEAYLRAGSGRLNSQLQKLSSQKTLRIPFLKLRWKKQTESIMEQILREEPVIGISKVLTPDTLSDVQGELKVFLSSCRKFDPALSIPEIGQAVRNYLVYAMFAELSNVRQSCTPAIFGYSMLYPVTDNYLDGERSPEQKAAYNAMILDKIKGRPVFPGSAHELKTCELLSSIESVYPRDQTDDIYYGLQLMLEAQRESLAQQDRRHTLSLEERLDISIYKGGLSVLIDRYLVKKEMTAEELRFFLGFGFFLQLADDLQDIAEDIYSGNQTIFTHTPEPLFLEQRVNQLLNFLFSLFHDYHAANREFQDFLLQNSINLILMSACKSREHFRSAYLSELETSFPVSFVFADRFRKESPLFSAQSEETKLLQIVDLFLEDC